jgi:hypothetical protein
MRVLYFYIYIFLYLSANLKILKTGQNISSDGLCAIRVNVLQDDRRKKIKACRLWYINKKYKCREKYQFLFKLGAEIQIRNKKK